MTDNEIIKALECCASVDDGCLTDCPLYDGDDSCFSTLLKPTLDLINRQKAEIERLNKIAIVPPCNIDDPVFFLGKYTGQIVQAYVTGIQKTQHDMFIFVDSGCFFSVNQQLGKSVFLTKEEAQKALEKENQK